MAWAARCGPPRGNQRRVSSWGGKTPMMKPQTEKRAAACAPQRRRRQQQPPTHSPCASRSNLCPRPPKPSPHLLQTHPAASLQLVKQAWCPAAATAAARARGRGGLFEGRHGEGAAKVSARGGSGGVGARAIGIHVQNRWVHAFSLHLDLARAHGEPKLKHLEVFCVPEERRSGGGL